MKKKTYHIISAIWFVLVILIVAATFLPIVDAVTQAEVKKYMIWVVVAGALSLMLMRRMVDDDK